MTDTNTRRGKVLLAVDLQDQIKKNEEKGLTLHEELGTLVERMTHEETAEYLTLTKV